MFGYITTNEGIKIVAIEAGLIHGSGYTAIDPNLTYYLQLRDDLGTIFLMPSGNITLSPTESLVALDFDETIQRFNGAQKIRLRNGSSRIRDITDDFFPDIKGLRKLLRAALEKGEVAIFSQNLDVEYILRCLEHVLGSEGISEEDKEFFEANKSKITIVGGRMIQCKMSHLVLWSMVTGKLPKSVTFYDDDQRLVDAFCSLQVNLCNLIYSPRAPDLTDSPDLLEGRNRLATFFKGTEARRVIEQLSSRGAVHSTGRLVRHQAIGFSWDIFDMPEPQSTVFGAAASASLVQSVSASCTIV